MIPDPTQLHPLPGHPRVVFLRACIRSPRIVVGDYTYYDDPRESERFEENNVLYHYGPERLVIGKYCALAQGVRFLMNGANHRMSGISTYPFPIFGGAWANHMDLVDDLPSRGDTVVGNDVWLGYEALVMPGVRIGDGAIVAARAVVGGEVRPYAIVGGNPARELRRRFDDATIERLLRIAWWDWPVEKVTRYARELMRADVAALEKAR